MALAIELREGLEATRGRAALADRARPDWPSECAGRILPFLEVRSTIFPSRLSLFTSVCSKNEPRPGEPSHPVPNLYL